MKIYETLLLFALVCALAAFFVMWAKLEEEKLKTREERKCYEEIIRLHNSVAVRAQNLANENGFLKEYAERKFDSLVRAKDENAKLQDRLSALLCPHNDHVWKDGVCAKCGRVKDATD